MTINVALAGAGAFGIKHLDAIERIDDASGGLGRRSSARTDPRGRRAVRRSTTSRRISPRVLALDDVDAVVLATPTQMHAEQTIACLDAGKHVEVEIPLCDNLADGIRVVEAQERTGLVAMCGHTRRFNPSHQWITGGSVLATSPSSRWTCRRTSSVAPTRTRSASRGAGPIICSGTTRPTPSTCSPTRPAARSSTPTRCRVRSIPSSGIAMDMSIQLRDRDPERSARCRCRSTTTDRSARSSATSATPARTSPATTTSSTATRSRSTCRASRCRPTASNSQDREFFAAITEGREPNSSVAQVLPLPSLDRLERQLGSDR